MCTDQSPELYRLPRLKLFSLNKSPFAPPQALGSTLLFPISKSLTPQVPHTRGVLQHLCFCDWLTSLGMKSSRFTRVVAGVRMSFLICMSLRCTITPHSIPALMDTWVVSVTRVSEAPPCSPWAAEVESQWAAHPWLPEVQHQGRHPRPCARGALCCYQAQTASQEGPFPHHTPPRGLPGLRPRESGLKSPRSVYTLSVYWQRFKKRERRSYSLVH